MIEKTLIDYGFSNIESKLYTLSLSYWALSVGSLSRLSDTSRTTVASAMKRLVNKWYASSYNKNSSTYFEVVSPKELEILIQNKVLKFQEGMPELMAIAQKFDSSTRVRVFEWLEGMKTMYMDTIAKEQIPMYSFMWTKELDDTFHTFLREEFLPQRIKRGVKAYVILTDNKFNKTYNAFKEDEFLKESKIIDHPKFKFSHEIIIYGENKVCFAMYTTTEMTWMIVEWKRFYETMKAIFDFIRDIV